MKVSARIAAVLAVIFAAFCMGFAITGFNSLRDATDAAQAADARGFAWFWTFLAGIGIVFGALSWWIAKTQKDE